MKQRKKIKNHKRETETEKRQKNQKKKNENTKRINKMMSIVLKSTTEDLFKKKQEQN